MTDAERLDQLLADQEKAIRKAFLEFLAAFGSGPVMDEVIRKLEARDVNGALAIVDSYVIRMADVLPAISAIVGTTTATELADSLSGNVLAISFNPSNPAAANIIASQRMEFIRDFSDAQRQSVQQALNRGYREGLGTEGLARRFRDAIGLHPQQEQWVVSFETQLRNRDRRALDRANRDRRFDPSIEAAITSDRQLTERQITAMVDRYRKRTLMMRAEHIARTEGLRATSEARDIAAGQMAQTLGLPDDRIVGTWRATRDNRVRDHHASMEGQKRPRGQPFIDGFGNRLRYPGDPAAPANTVINCRCGVVYTIAQNA